MPSRPGPGWAGQGLGLSVLMDQKSPKWKVLLPGESPGWPSVGPWWWWWGGAWVLQRWPDFQRQTCGGGRVLACDLGRGVCPGCRGTSEHVWSLSVAPGERCDVPGGQHSGPSRSPGGSTPAGVGGLPSCPGQGRV